MSKSRSPSLAVCPGMARDGGGGVAASRAICPKCKLPKATARDIIRWRSFAVVDEVCFSGRIKRMSNLMPYEEIADESKLRRIVIQLRKELWESDCYIASLEDYATKLEDEIARLKNVS